MSLISYDDVRAEWDRISGLSANATERLVRSLWQEQPIVAAYVMAMTRDLGADAFVLGTQMALTIDCLYERLLARKPVQVPEDIIDRADDAIEQSAALLVGVEPEIAMQRMLNQREFAQPEIPYGLIQLTIDEDEEEDTSSTGFLIAKTLSLAYEYANDLQPEGAQLGRFADVIEEQIGGPAPKVGRNDPCPCGSGKKFKHCHGDTALREPTPPRVVPHAEQLFWDYMDLIGATMEFFRDLRSQPTGKKHWEAFEHFEEQFRVGDSGGILDSIQVGYFLFDLALPNSSQTVGERFLISGGATLSAQEKTRLRLLIDSHLGFYEYVGRRADTTRKELRDLVTNQSWLVSAVDDPEAEHDSPGDILIVRLVGPVDDAVMSGMPVLLAPAAKPVLEGFGRKLIDDAAPQGTDLVANNRIAMKAGVPVVADFLVSTGLLDDFEEGDDDFDDDELDDELDDEFEDDEDLGEDDEWEVDPDFDDEDEDDEDKDN